MIEQDQIPPPQEGAGGTEQGRRRLYAASALAISDKGKDKGKATHRAGVVYAESAESAEFVAIDDMSRVCPSPLYRKPSAGVFEIDQDDITRAYLDARPDLRERIRALIASYIDESSVQDSLASGILALLGEVPR